MFDDLLYSPAVKVINFLVQRKQESSNVLKQPSIMLVRKESIGSVERNIERLERVTLIASSFL